KRARIVELGAQLAQCGDVQRRVHAGNIAALEKAKNALSECKSIRAAERDDTDTARATSRATTSGPTVVPGLTQAQCSAMGGRIKTYTNTAGRGQDVGECLVPPRIADNSNTSPRQQVAPSTAQAPIQLPQQGDAGPSQTASPRIVALPPDQRDS